MNENRLKEQAHKVPESFTQSIYAGADRIHKYEKKRIRYRRIGIGVAAILIIGLFPVFNRPRSDAVTAQVADKTTENPDAEIVFVSPTDEYYHTDRACSGCDTDAVSMILTTAEEFQKEPCPLCFVQDQ